ncbi:MAG: hypothetical protein IJN56_02050 [Clostridia bacterium]|nr:hypothetical protein [Clostridia bacterium]
MKNEFLITAGFIVYIILSGIDRFFVSIPNIIYIPVMIANFILIIVGIILKRKNK